MDKPVRVLHSFPHRLGKGRICTTAWYEIATAANSGAQVTVMAGDSVRPFDGAIPVRTTLSMGRIRVPYRLIGTVRACAIHDYLTSRFLLRNPHSFDIVHAWPLAARRTMDAARLLGVPVVLERCNAHTRYAYEIVQAECERIGVPLPSNHEHAFNDVVLAIEEEEYAHAYRLLCPSDFVKRTFLDRGHRDDTLARHMYGFDDEVFFPRDPADRGGRGLDVLFAGVCAVRKGLHFALEAWCRSAASRRGRFRIAGEFIPGYKEKLRPLLEHPSVEVLGHRKDVPELMRESDVLILPSIEEGSALVCSEAIGSGCVPVVSSASCGVAKHGVNALIHDVGDVVAIGKHIDDLDGDPELLARLRRNCIESRHSLSWDAAGEKLVAVYRDAINSFRREQRDVA